MSINSAMLAGTSGMRANASTLAAISDNIANVNTVGYKRLRSDFSALLTTQNRSTTYNAAGVTSMQTAMVNQQGSLQSSSSATHLAVSGDGFFVTRARGADATSLDPYYYTRAGQFSSDADGLLRNASGYYLHGWPVNDAGEVQSTPTDLTALEPVRVSNIAGGAQGTAQLAMSANLDSSRPITAAAATYDATNPLNNMASGTGVEPDFETSVQFYDSQGGLHRLTMAFLKTGANTWAAEIYLPDGEVDAGGTLVNGQIAVGELVFTPFGQFDADASTFPTELNIFEDGSGLGPEWAAGLGFAEQTIALDIGGGTAPGGLTQYDSPSVLVSTQVDGSPFGSLSSVEIDEDGFVTAIFSNGLSRRIYQVPIATFTNDNGLIPEEGGAYRAGPNAGLLNMKSAGQAGAGGVQSYALESSTVDLAEEFSNLITTQRAYSASSKIITTADEMLDELIRLKR